MSLNPQAQGNSMVDVLQGSVSSHFSRLESVLLQNEAINGQYNLVTSAAYANNTPVKAPGFTKVCFSTNGSIIADLENSYIEADLTYKLRYSGINNFDNARLPAPGDGGALLADEKGSPITKFFIGFKQSLDALERYDLYVNANIIYSQPFVGPESTIMLAGVNDTIKENNPFVYTSFKNASTMDANVCGVYVDLKDVNEDETFTVKIPIKINLHQFLLLSPIHYLPSFAGKWELQLYFGSKNLVICPVNPECYFEDKTVAADFNGITTAEFAYDAEAAANSKVSITAEYTPDFLKRTLEQIVHTHEKDEDKPSKLIGWANYFTQINTEMPVYTWDTGNKKPKWEKITLSCVDTTVDPCLMNTTQFQLRYEVYQALMQHYVEHPLIIPTNTLSYQRFAHGATSNGNTQLTATANLPVENIDAMFILLPESDSQQTCYYQPYLSEVRVGLGEFGIRPQRPMDTHPGNNKHNNRRFITYVLDALNLESSQISAMSKDFSNSVLPHAIEYYRDGNDIKYKETYTVANRMSKQYDNSNFIIGIPLSQVGFQSGCVSSPNANINFQFDVKVDHVPWDDAAYKSFGNGAVVAMFLTDCELLIQVSPNSDIPVVKLSSRTIV